MNTKQWAIASDWAQGDNALIAALNAADESELTERALAFSAGNIPEDEEPAVTKTGVIVALIDMGLFTPPEKLAISPDTLRAMTYFALGVIKGAEFADKHGIHILEEEWLKWDDHYEINLWFKDDQSEELSAAVYPVVKGRTDGTRWVMLDLEAARKGTL